MKLMEEINIFHSCREFNIPVWSCPRFIFTIMGLVNIVSILATYYIGQNYADPEIIIVIVTLLTIFLLIITHILVGAFEKVLDSRRAEGLRTKEILELKDQFVYIAVHNIRSGATAIKWGLRTLESQLGHLTQADKKVFSLMRSRNERLLRLVHNVLLITMIEAKKIDITTEHIAIQSLFHEDLKSLLNQTELHISPEAVSSTIVGDPQYVPEVLNLLLDNAVFHADAEKPMITVRVTREKEHIAIAIQNNGTEISAEDHPSVFRKFWRANKSGDIERTGFGLYIAKELTILMGGKLSFESVPNKTVFTLLLRAGA